MPEVDTSVTQEVELSGEATTTIYLSSVVYEDRYSLITSIKSFDSTNNVLSPTTDLFTFTTYSYLKELQYEDSEGNPSMTYEQSSEGKYEVELSSSEMSIVEHYYYNEADSSQFTLYENFNISDPSFRSIAGGGSSTTYEMAYYNDESAGIRAKFGATSTSSYQALAEAFSSSVNTVYETVNTSKFNFKSIKSADIKPYNISSLNAVSEITGSETTVTNTQTTSGGGGGY